MRRERWKGKILQVEGVKRAPELLVSQVLTKEQGQKKEWKKNKVVGWSTEKMEEKGSKQEFNDTEDMVQWRSINQEETDSVWKKRSWTLEEEVLEKFKVEVQSKR